jgi:hypothetical protein
LQDFSDGHFGIIFCVSKYVLQHLFATGVSQNKLILNFLSFRKNKECILDEIFFAGKVADIQKKFLPCAPNFRANNK